MAYPMYRGPLPGISGFRDPTQQQVAQLQGLDPSAAGDPYAEQGWQPFNARNAGVQAGFSALTNLGAGLLSGRNWSEGLSRGLMGANQGFQEGMRNARRDYYVDQQGRYMQSKMAAEDRATKRQDEQQAGIDQLISQLPPDQQALARVDPSAFIGAKVGQMFPKPQQPTSDIQNWQFYKQQGGNLPFNDWMLQSKKAGAPSTSVTVGGTSVQMPYPLTTATQTSLQGQEISDTDALARINSVRARFKPEYQQLGTRAGMAVASLKDWMNVPLDEPTKKNLYEFTQYRRDAVDNLNRTIKDLTGTAMGVQEAARIITTQPNAGTGIFDGDGPTEFQAKLDGVTQNVKLALMRKHWALKQKVDPLQTGIDLASVPNLIRKTGDELKAGMAQQNPGLSEDKIDMMVKDKLRDIFGAF